MVVWHKSSIKITKQYSLSFDCFRTEVRCNFNFGLRAVYAHFRFTFSHDLVNPPEKNCFQESKSVKRTWNITQILSFFKKNTWGGGGGGIFVTKFTCFEGSPLNICGFDGFPVMGNVGSQSLAALVSVWSIPGVAKVVVEPLKISKKHSPGIIFVTRFTWFEGSPLNVSGLPGFPVMGGHWDSELGSPGLSVADSSGDQSRGQAPQN